MKTLVTNYTFSAAAKQITFTDYPSLKLDQILLVTNVTDNVIIYNFADPTAGGTLAGNVLTLLYNTTTMSNTDRLQIFIDDLVTPSTEASLTAVQVKIDSTNTLLNVLTGKNETINIDVSSINLNTDQIESKLDNIDSEIASIYGVVDNVEPLLDTTNSRLQTIATQTAFGTVPGQPLYVNPGALLDTVDSVSIDKSIGQTATTALTSKVFVSGSRKVYNIFGITTADTNQYLQIYNSTTSTIPTSTPIGVFLIPANSNFSFDLSRGLNFTSGALIVNSITPVTYTQGNDDLFITVVHN